MPYRPTELSKREQAQQWYQQHPEAVRRLREMGVSGADPALLDPSFAADNPDIVPVLLDPIQDKKKRYYRKHPDQDPQSTASKVLEFLGLDQPYRNDSRSYDYQKKKWDQSVQSGSPDLSWFLPGLTDDATDVMHGSMQNNYGQDDPRTEEQKWQGGLDDFLSFPLLGMQDETVAAIGSMTGHGTYDENLGRARELEDAGMEWTPAWNRMFHTLAGLPLDAPVLMGGAALAGKGLSSIKKAAGLAPATTRLGKTAEEIATTSPAFAAEDAIWQMGNGRGDLNERADGFNPNWAIAASLFPVWMGGGSLLRGAGEAAWEAGSKAGRKLFGGGKKAPKTTQPGKPLSGDAAPVPQDTMPRPPQDTLPRRPVTDPIPPGRQPSVRDDLNSAIYQSRTRDRG